MSSYPKREYTLEEIEKMITCLRNDWGMNYSQKAADMLESLASQLASQKREGERKSGVYSELWVSIMNARNAYERTEDNYRDPKSRTILRKQCRMISEFLRSCDPLLTVQSPSSDQDREVSP